MTYSDWQQRQLDAWWPKRPAATPTQPFDAWLRERMAEQDADDVAALVDEGWLEADAIAHVMANPREGGGA